MARGIIQRTEIQARLQRGLHLKDSQPAPHVADVVVPVILVEDMSRIDDAIQLSDQRPYWGTTAQGASVGNFSLVRLVNVAFADPRQNKITVVDRVIINVAGINWGMAVQAQAGGSVAGFNRDSRYAPLQGSSSLIDAATPAAAPQSGFTAPSAVGQVEDIGVVLSPGFELAVYGTVVNTGITVTFFWREFDTIVK